MAMLKRNRLIYYSTGWRKWQTSNWSNGPSKLRYEVVPDDDDGDGDERMGEVGKENGKAAAGSRGSCGETGVTVGFESYYKRSLARRAMSVRPLATLNRQAILPTNNQHQPAIRRSMKRPSLQNPNTCNNASAQANKRQRLSLSAIKEEEEEEEEEGEGNGEMMTSSTVHEVTGVSRELRNAYVDQMYESAARSRAIEARSEDRLEYIARSLDRIEEIVKAIKRGRPPPPSLPVCL
ncbi:hypothetical protein FISHEDRAFT_59830 [Fistulina hepatica ATCC 64428]|uniref:Uncharacterized protein n=1 Tax=Fistulina hepatica ATCC 64428 TaxID=1128425 RepID=A0A0D7A847_9AGAR|nr:hypothetical protein FISHEDRAFT_59830 [Fistulina hepatica ATCC 64428]